MALGLGEYNPLPLTLGGGESIDESEHMALLDAFAPAWDAAEGSASYAEAQAYAHAISLIWAVNQRLVNQAIPGRMLEALTDWEKILKLRPAPQDRDIDRRAAVAAKLRGLAGNTIADIGDAVTASLGANFEELVFSDASDDITYWPGVNPGPPGFEWCSTRVHLGIRMNTNGLSANDIDSKRDACGLMLDSLLPAWMTYTIGVGTGGFVCDVSVCDLTFL